MKLNKLHMAARWVPLAAALILGGWQASALADSCASGSTCVFGSSGGQDNSLTKEDARQQKEQWDDTRSLRNKVNTRVEKQFDKFDKAVDLQDSCEKSLNVNAYWEPNTQRCLDRNIGRPLNP